MMSKVLIILSMGLFVWESTPKEGPDSVAGMRMAAEQFIKVVDDQSEKPLASLLHPELVHYVQLGDQLLTFGAADYIQMVAEKKVGGKPRKVNILSISTGRNGIGEVKLQAVSEEYDFMYYLSMVQQNDQWVIIGIVADLHEV